MNAQAGTVARLRRLVDLYERGYQSTLVDQTVGKLFALEIKQAKAELQRLDERMAQYEHQYRMSSEEFYGRFTAGELGDDMDFMEWSIFYDMRQRTAAHLDELEARQQ